MLSAEQQRLWRILSVFPGTFDAKAATSVWELETDPTQEALSELVRCSLVEWEEKEERYRLHDLVRQLADRKIETTERDAAQRRHAEHYLKVLWEARDFYFKGGEGVLLALRLFDVEWGNIQSGYTWAESHFLEDDEASRVCGDYPNAGTYLLLLRLHPQEQIRWREIALAAARRGNDKAREALHLGNLGIAYWHLDEPRRSIEYYEQWRAIAHEIGDRLGEASASWNLGLVYEDDGNLSRAADLMQVRVDFNREIGHLSRPHPPRHQ